MRKYSGGGGGGGSLSFEKKLNFVQEWSLVQR